MLKPKVVLEGNVNSVVVRVKFLNRTVWMRGILGSYRENNEKHLI